MLLYETNKRSPSFAMMAISALLNMATIICLFVCYGVFLKVGTSEVPNLAVGTLGMLDPTENSLVLQNLMFHE